MSACSAERAYAKFIFQNLCEYFGVPEQDAEIRFPQSGSRAYYSFKDGKHVVVIPVDYIICCEHTSFIPEYPEYRCFFEKYVGKPEDILPFEKVAWVVKHEFAHLLTRALDERESTSDPNGYHGINWQNNLKIVCEIQ